MTEKRLILSFLFLFALSAVYLFSMNEHGLDPDRGKSWWSLAFTQPADRESLVFTLTNYTDTPDFRYTINVDGTTRQESTLSVPTGTSLDHNPGFTVPTDAKATITVWQDDEHQTIFR